jgi:hypothetical protein
MSERIKALFPSERRLRAILQARATGGAITLAELEQIWHLKTKWRTPVLCMAEGPEREQIEIMLRNIAFRAMENRIATPMSMISTRSSLPRFHAWNGNSLKCVMSFERPTNFYLSGLTQRDRIILY